MLSLALLGAALVGGLLLIPFGLPGLWVMLGAALLHWVLVPLGGIGLWTAAGAGALVVAAEVLELKPLLNGSSHQNQPIQFRLTCTLNNLKQQQKKDLFRQCGRVLPKLWEHLLNLQLQ